MAGVLGFILLIIESLIIMQLKGLQTIEYGGIAPFINVWAINFFFVYSILSQIIHWYENKVDMEKGEEDHFY